MSSLARTRYAARFWHVPLDKRYYLCARRAPDGSRRGERRSATASAKEVARYFLAVQDEGAGERITHLKLQKLLFYAQGYHLALYGEPLFNEPVEAWDHGPVVRPVWDTYRDHGRDPIPMLATADFAFTQDVRDLLDNVLDSFGVYSALGLRNLTHRDAPWRDAFAQGANTEIPTAIMGRYFRSRLLAMQPRQRTWAEALANPRFKRAVDEGLDDIANGRTELWSEVEQSLPST